MELVLEQHEIEELLKVGLKAKGVELPPYCTVRVRRNGKKNTLRMVFVGGWGKAPTPKRKNDGK